MPGCPEFVSFIIGYEEAEDVVLTTCEGKVSNISESGCQATFLSNSTESWASGQKCYLSFSMINAEMEIDGIIRNISVMNSRISLGIEFSDPDKTHERNIKALATVLNLK